MVVGLAFVATAVSTLFAQSMLVRWTAAHRPHHGAWALALAFFALAGVALSVGTSTGWDHGTFRVFFLFGAVLNVPWLAMGTIHLLARPAVATRVRRGLVWFTAFAAGVILVAPMSRVHGTGIPRGSDVFGAWPRVLAGVGSGVGASVVFAGAAVSAWRFAHDRALRDGRRLALANGLIALGTLVLSAGGIVEGAVGHDEAFVLSLAVGIVVIDAGFVLAGGRSRTVATESHSE